MERSCPRCKKILTRNEFFFCLSCGYKLEDQLVYYPKEFFGTKETVLFVSQEVKTAKIPKKIKINKKNFLLVLITIIILPTAITLTFSFREFIFKPKAKTISTSITPKREYLNTIKVDLGMKSGDFFSDDIEFFVPFDATFYLEGNDFNKIINYTDLDNNKESIAAIISSDISGHFIVFGKNVQGTILYAGAFLLRDKDNFNLENLKLSDEWKKITVDNYLLIAPNQEILDEMLINKAKTQKSIYHNPKFSSMKSLLDKNGQLIFMYFGDQKVDDFMLLVYNYISDTKLTKVIDEIISNKFDKFVLKN
ncbi:hypothetical protein A2V49_03575 [candidate division WWE3 bacterium RBG_19FT_COMBO_34_6]|uniref:Zinc-ribbon domain-containing protein n=1 Tax=candidate division WWE3 bacterium RBG_19FT_COMBO_34_6 TaxID=1802612 RepID=A0A1F4UN41_UNCKA|nr:MAG: hypothetical protein A2V49_03575 [candidate division WWE3 bacterium RBG_19FT_COMBO_34_6]